MQNAYFVDVPERAEDLCKYPEKASALLQIFIKGRDFLHHITNKKGPVQTADLYEDPGKHRVPLQTSWESLCSSPKLPEGQNLLCHISQGKGLVQIADLWKGPGKGRRPLWRFHKSPSLSSHLPKVQGPSPNIYIKGRIQAECRSLQKCKKIQVTCVKVLGRFKLLSKHFWKAGIFPSVCHVPGTSHEDVNRGGYGNEAREMVTSME